MVSRFPPRKSGSYFRSGRSYEQNGRSRAGYSYQGAEPFQRASDPQLPKEKGEGGFPDLTDEQQSIEDAFLIEGVYPILLKQVTDHPRYAWRWKQKRPPALIRADLVQTLQDDVRRWLQKLFQKQLCNPIGTYTKAQLATAANKLKPKTYDEILTEAYGDVNNGWQRTKQTAPAGSNPT